jgi:hypothetical protein
MTDLSKNSRGRNADTVSNTGNRSYQGKVNTFSKHSSQSESRCKCFFIEILKNH